MWGGKSPSLWGVVIHEKAGIPVPLGQMQFSGPVRLYQADKWTRTQPPED